MAMVVRGRHEPEVGAIEEQFGHKPVSKSGPAEVLVIDHVENQTRTRYNLRLRRLFSQETSAIVPRRASMSKTTLIATAVVFVILGALWYFLIR